MKTLDRLDDVAWSTLSHAMGSAENIPALVRTLTSADPSDRKRARAELASCINHQGVHRGDATVAAIPYLVGLAAVASTPEVDALLRLLAELAVGDTWLFQHDGFHPQRQTAIDECSRPKAYSVVRAGNIVVRGFPSFGEALDLSPGAIATQAYDAVRAGLPVYLALGASSDSRTRASLAYLLAWFPQAVAESVALLESFTEDGEPDVRAAAWLSLSHATKFDPEFRSAAIERMQSAWDAAPTDLDRRAIALGLVRLEDPEASGGVRPRLCQWLAEGMPKVIPDDAFPWRRIDTAPFVFCTTYIGTEPERREDVIEAARRGLARIDDEHDAADLAGWLLRAGLRLDEPVEEATLELLTAVAEQPKCWHFSDTSSLLGDLELPDERAALLAWAEARRRPS